MAGIELQSLDGKVGARAFDAYLKCFAAGLLIRTTGDVIALSPPLIIEKAEIDKLVDTLQKRPEAGRMTVIPHLIAGKPVSGSWRFAGLQSRHRRTERHGAVRRRGGNRRRRHRRAVPPSPAGP